MPFTLCWHLCTLHKLVARRGNAYLTGKISTVDLQVLTSSEQLLFKLKFFIYFLTKQVILIGRSTVLSRPLIKGSLTKHYKILQQLNLSTAVSYERSLLIRLVPVVSKDSDHVVKIFANFPDGLFVHWIVKG